MTERSLDVICMGRAGVDLYGEQIGGRLEDMQSFRKYLGGSPANIAVGSARLGLRSAMLTRVGDEHMGRFIRQTLAREGVDVSHVKTDPERLTALVILGIRDRETFPLIFYRENCADMALAANDVDAAFIAGSRALLVSGTHFSAPGVDRACRAAMAAARDGGTRIVFDIDYRPVLWGLTGPGEGEERFVASDRVSTHLQGIVADCDLVVGTEEEFHIAGGQSETVPALRRIRELTDAVLVLKRGPRGCVVFPTAVPTHVEEGATGPGFEVEVFNVLGAGDAFLSGFLRGWLREEPWQRCCALGNACGALVVSRHGCAPAMPSWDELMTFVAAGGMKRPDGDRVFARLHRASNREREWPELQVLDLGTPSPTNDEAAAARRARLVALISAGVRGADDDRHAVGVIIDPAEDDQALMVSDAGDSWIGRPIASGADVSTSASAVSASLRSWPTDHVAICRVHGQWDKQGSPSATQEEQLQALYDACVTTEHELLLEIVARSEDGGLPVAERVVSRLYDRGIYPDWWLLGETLGPASWERLSQVVAGRDRHCRGVLVRRSWERDDEVTRGAVAVATRQPLCKGFVANRHMIAEAERDWLAERLDDDGLVTRVAIDFRRAGENWRQARSG